MTMRATWNGVIVAESDHTRVVEGNHYFPPHDVRREHLQKSRFHTACPWKGLASYYNVVVNVQTNRNAAWYYPHPFPFARKIKNYVAFWSGVQVVDVPAANDSVASDCDIRR
jgi:uncharacterized protein (DUF427 family)